MHLKKLEVNARKALVIIDDRNWYDQPASKFLETELQNAGCDRRPSVLVQVNLVGNVFKMLRQNLQNFGHDSGGLCVFPGRSAALVRGQAEWQDRYVGPRFGREAIVSVHAARRFDEHGNSLVTVGEILPERTVLSEIRTIVVVDDVISSGITCRRLYERNHHKFPRALWYACACVSRLEKIKGYEEVITPLLVPLDASGLKVPINSLTTLMEEIDIGRRYATKHCRWPEVFLAALTTVKSEFSCNPDQTDMHLVPWRDVDRAILNLPPL